MRRSDSGRHLIPKPLQARFRVGERSLAARERFEVSGYRLLRLRLPFDDLIDQDQARQLTAFKKSLSDASVRKICTTKSFLEEL